MKRLSLEQKINLIKSGKAYVAKCDGSYFIYITLEDGSQLIKKLTKKQYEELSYE